MGANTILQQPKELEAGWHGPVVGTCKWIVRHHSDTGKAPDLAPRLHEDGVLGLMQKAIVTYRSEDP